MTLAPAATKQITLGPMISIGLLFFIFGFVTWLNGPLITFVKLAFDLDDVNAFPCRWRSTCPTSSWRCQLPPFSAPPA